MTEDYFGIGAVAGLRSLCNKLISHEKLDEKALFCNFVSCRFSSCGCCLQAFFCLFRTICNVFVTICNARTVPPLYLCSTI